MGRLLPHTGNFMIKATAYGMPSARSAPPCACSYIINQSAENLVVCNFCINTHTR